MKKIYVIGGNVLVALSLAAAVAGASSGVAQKINFLSAKPQGKALNDEQQGILAVRAAKASVVSITGISSIPVSGQVALVASLPSINGTGFVISADGYIVSNSHVVQDVNYSYTVMLADGREYDAKIVGLDKYDDVALIKIEAGNLPAATLGDSDALEAGQTVFAIGNALGKYNFTVTKGVVSGLGRQVETDSTTMPRLRNLIQTDASINPGNSGGPLIDSSGQVVGVNTVMDRAGESLGFAVPINVVKQAVDQFRTYGKVYRPWLGVEFTTITKPLQVMQNLPLGEGAWIRVVKKDGPAEAAGLQVGDIVTKINGQVLNSAKELDQVVSQFTSGQQILVTYYRKGVSYDAPLVLGEFK